MAEEPRPHVVQNPENQGQPAGQIISNPTNAEPQPPAGMPPESPPADEAKKDEKKKDEKTGKDI